MTNTDNRIPQSLKDALRAGTVVPFVGAGVSMAVKQKNTDGTASDKSLYPSWKQFLLNAADKLEANNKQPKADVVRSLLNDSPPDYLDAAQRAADGLGQTLWGEALKENFERDIDDADPQSLALPNLIWELGSNLLVTTNVDSVLQSVHPKPHSVKILDAQTPEFADVQTNWRPARPTALHLHGHIDNRAHVVFTRRNYEDFYNLANNRAKLETLRSLFTQRTILFIGYSLDDFFVLRELERVQLIYQGGATSHYVIVREKEKDSPAIPSYIEKVTFADFGEPLLEMLREMRDIAVSGRGGNPPSGGAAGSGGTGTGGSAAARPFFGVPYNTKGDGFIGRDGKIQEIEAALTKEGCAAIGQAVNVRGYGGLGKTQLAVEYAHYRHNQHSQAVYWVVADENIEPQLVQIAERRGWIIADATSGDQIEEAQKKFRALTDCLVIFDNVEQAADIAPYLPQTDLRTHLLITSRYPQDTYRQIPLELLPPDEASELLVSVAGRAPQSAAEQAALDGILAILDGIPLALELVGGYLAGHETVTFGKYLKFLDETPLDALENEFPDGNFTRHDRSIVRTLRISEKVIEEKPLLAEMLKTLAWSGSAAMGVSLLRALLKSEDEFAFETALGEAHKLHLIKREKDAERYAIHRLLAKVIRHENPLADNREWLQTIVTRLNNWFAARKEDFHKLTEFEGELEHLNEWRQHAENNLPETAVWLPVLQAYPLRQRGSYAAALPLLEQAYGLYRRSGIDKPGLLASVQNELGMTYGELGQHEEALKYQQDALTIRREVLGERHPYTAASLNNVGSTYGDLGRHEEALKYLLQALKIYREMLGRNHPNTVIIANNLIRFYDKLGYNERANELKKEFLDSGT